MNIAASSTIMSQAQLKQDVGVSLMKKTMDMAESNSQQMVNMLKQSTVQTPHPTLGNTIDMKG